MVRRLIFPHVSHETKKTVSRAILITGNARSGTTIAGKIIGACKDCEYFFEPELLFSLFAIIDKIPKDAWKLLFETYVGEDLLGKAVIGRNVNLRQSDDSSFYNTKSKSEYNNRIKIPGCRSNVQKRIKQKIPVIKIPDIIPFLYIFQKYYPQIKIIICRRDFNNTFKSIKKKKWYHSSAKKGYVWPSYEIKGCEIPFWVQQKEWVNWPVMSTENRIVLNTFSNKITADLKYIEFNYDKLINSKKQCLSFLKKLKIKPTKKTTENIKAFRKH